MSFHLYGPKRQPDLDLGDWFALSKAWAELAAVIPETEEAQFWALYAVPYTNEEDLSAQDLGFVRAQAILALKDYASVVSVPTRRVLETLAGP